MFHGDTIELSTRGRGVYELTPELQRIVRSSGVARGLCTVFVHHTSASLLINENADPDVWRDFEAFMSRLVPDGDALFRHIAEGPDDMPSHVRSALTQTSIGIPVAGGRCDLGTWQGLYLWEHRRAAHTRRVSVSILGESA
jgi:secondary thiamine-phosphate synthase enzyme